MTTKITPTVGRVVWFYPPTGQCSPDFSPPAAGQPLAAIVAAVLAGCGIDIVNLTVFDAVGTPYPISLVPLIQEGQELPEQGFYATWMPYQVDQAKKAEDKASATACQTAGGANDMLHMRYDLLTLATRTPGMNGHYDVLKAAAAYQAHIAGEPVTSAPNGGQLPSEREKTMEELLRSACAIADRKGENTAWERFAASVHELGLNGVTARTYRVLPSDVE